jgi:hypothetical protein
MKRLSAHLRQPHLRTRVLIGAFAAALSIGFLCAQSKLTVSQLVSFIESSIKLKQPDKQVAAYLAKLKLSERLDSRTIEDLQGEGAGPATMDALRRMVEASIGLPGPGPKVAKPTAPTMPPPSVGEQKAIIERVREYATNYSKNLPNFICTQVTRRYYDRTGQEQWEMNDTLTTRLTYFDQKETYKLVMVNNHATEENYHGLGGALSTGEFGTMLQQIFEMKSQASFAWLRWGKLRGHVAHVYAYMVPQPNSEWRLQYERRDEVVVGYKGLIYVDKDTELILKVTLEGKDIPPNFPIQQASNALDYDYTTIGDQTFLLPLKGEMRMRHDKFLTKNVLEFHLYRKFGADTSVTFDTPEAMSDEKTKEESVTKEESPK